MDSPLSRALASNLPGVAATPADPRDRDTLRPASPDRQGEQPLFRKLRGAILVVDDDADVRAVMVDLLDAAGYSVRAAANGADALRVLDDRSHLPSLIFLDVEMPVMNGREFLARRAQEAELNGIPVVVASAIDRHLEGIEGFLRKPVDVERLLRFAEAFAR